MPPFVAILFPMKKNSFTCILCIFLIGLFSTPLKGQTLEEILEKMIQAQGGKTAIEKIKDMKITGTIEVLQQGLIVPFTQYKKEPDKRRIEMEVMGSIQVQLYDGEKAWEFDPKTGKALEIPGEDAVDIKRGSLALDWILYPENYGITLIHKGKEIIDDKDYIVLEQVYPEGGKVVNYVDPDTYLIHKIKSTILDEMMVEVETETFLSDYKTVKGYVMAHTMTSYLHGKEYMKISFKKVKLNTRLPNHLFYARK
jgi:outer membrane lipoprotein-sorting protein